MPDILMLVVILLVGLCIGSFLNVVIYRLPLKKSIVLPASKCPECNTRLKVLDLIPVLSFVFRRGRCSYCNSKISWQYPLIETFTGIIYVLLYLKFDFTINFFIMVLLVSILIVIALIDIKYMVIYNKITYSGIIIGVILSIFFEHITFFNSILGVMIPSLLLFLLALVFKNGLGMGDVKLVAMIGAFIGFSYTLLAVFIGSLIGTFISVPLIIAGFIDRKTKIPFGALISLGAIISIFYGEFLLEWYLQYVKF